MSKWSTEYVNALPNSAFAYVAADGSRHLPYKNAEGRVDLPHVRNALARLDQVDGMSASEKENVKEKLQGSLKASDANDEVLQSISVIKADDSNQLPTRMMLLRAGTFYTQKYGEVPLQADDLKEMASNFKAGVGMAGSGETGIPVDFAHQSHLNAAAWIKDMAVENNDELWATNIEYSKSGREALLGKEYKMLSSDFYPASFGEWVDSESGARAKNVIVGAALTNRPMFTGNQPVIASDTSDKGGQNTNKVIYVIASQEKEKSMNIDEVRIKAAEDVTGAEQRYLQANAEKLSAEEKKKFEIAELAASVDKDGKTVQASSVRGDEGVVSVEASELKGLTDKVSKLEASAEATKKAQVEAEVDKHIARGAIKADQKEKWVGLIVADDSNKELLAGLADNSLLAKEQGSGDADEDQGQSARDQLMAHATKIVKDSDGKSDIKAAYEMAKEQHPELVTAAATEGKARLTASDEQFAAAGVNRG